MKIEVIDRAYGVLEGCAHRREVISYSRLSSLVPGLPVRGRGMVETLLAVSERSWNQHGVLLPVLVVHAGRGGLPGVGFFESLTFYRPYDDQANRIKAARRERERVHAAYPTWA